MAADKLLQLKKLDNKNILEIIELLGESLVSGQFEERKLAMNFLVEVLEGLPIGHLKSKEVITLLNYLMEKVSDQHVLTEVLHGLTSLIQSYGKDFSDDEVQNVLHKLFHELDNQSLVQSQRFLYYTILELFMNYNKLALQKMGHDFVFGFIQSMDGEKDPRSLVIAFKLATAIAKEFDITRFVEEFFDIIACYFPIDFSPPPNDPHGITRELLETMNRNCLCATPKFASLLLPLVLEKAGIVTSLDGNSSSSTSGGITPAVRREVLLTISEICRTPCPPEVLAKFEVELMSFIRRVVFITPDEPSLGVLDSNGQPFQCCEAITRCMANSNYLQQWVSRLLREARPYLLDPQGASFVAPARALLLSCARATPLACSQILDNVISQLLHAVKVRVDDKAVTRALLDVLCCLLQVAVVHSFENTCVLDSVVKYKSALLNEAYSLTQSQFFIDDSDVTFAALGFTIFGHLLQFSGLLCATESEQIIHFLTDKLIALNNCESVLAVLIPFFVQYCQGQLLTEPVQSALTSIKNAAVGDHCTTSCVQFLAQIGACTSLQEDILACFCSALQIVKGFDERVILWQGIDQLVELVVTKFYSDEETKNNVCFKLWTVLRTTLLSQINMTDVEHFKSACSIIRNLLSSTNAEFQHHLIKNYLLSPLETQFLAENVVIIGPILQLLEAIVFAIRPEVATQFVDVLLKPLLNYFVINRQEKVLSQHEHTEAEVRLAICCSILVNKSISRKLDDAVAHLMTACATSLRHSKDKAAQMFSSSLYIWTSLLSRAALMAGHAMATEWLHLLSDYWPKMNDVSGYALILRPLCSLRLDVNEPKHAVCSCVAAQRCFLFLQSLLLQKMHKEEIENDEKEIDLDACRVAAHFSQLVMTASDDSSLLPVLKECSKSVDEHLWRAAPQLVAVAASTFCLHADHSILVLILRLFVWLSSLEDTVKPSASLLLPQILPLTNATANYSSHIRVAALQLLEPCLCALSSSERVALRHTVLSALRIAVDDVKRSVRREAMRVCNRWFLLDAAK